MTDPSEQPREPGRPRWRVPSWLLYVVPVLVAVLLALAVTGRAGPLGVPGTGLIVLLLGSVALIFRRQIGEQPVSRSDRAPRAELRRAFALRVAVWGLLLVPLSVVVAAAVGNTPGAFVAAPFAAVAVPLALFLRLTGRGLLITIILSAFLFLFVLADSTHLSHPESFADFVPAVMRLIGAALAIVGTAVARAKWRRGAFAEPKAGRRRVVLAGAAGLLAIAGISGLLNATQHRTVVTASGATVVGLRDDEFSPNRIEVGVGKRVKILARNTDSYSHSFTIDALEVDEYVGPGADRLITFRVPENAHGRFELTCTVTGHEGMTGTISVTT